MTAHLLSLILFLPLVGALLTWLAGEKAARPVALCLAQDGGTNALALRPADAIEPAFGLRNGAALTVERARAAGFEAVVIDDPGLALDVDTPEDLERVRELGEGTRTHVFLSASHLLEDPLP